MKTEKLSEKGSSIEKLINQLTNEIKEYLTALKEDSINEIMNGSIIRAQELLDKVLPIQNTSEELFALQSKLINLLNSNQKSAKSEIKFANNEKIRETKNNQSNVIIRSNILKALIYLGGNADLNEISDFVKREIMKNGLVHEKEKPIIDDKEKLKKIITEESYLMMKESLVIEDNLSKKWEILPAGIDSLSKYDIETKKIEYN